MNVELTVMSAGEYDRIGSGQMTPQMASAYLKEERIALRTFDEVLRQVYEGEDMAERLVEAFAQAEPDANPRSVAKKVANWMTGKSKPTSREDVYRIAFALEVSESQCSVLLGQCCEYGIHYRDGRDVVYAWFLRSGGSFDAARAFYATLPKVPLDVEYPLDCRTHITQELQYALQLVQTEKDLRDFYIGHITQFGQLHVRAYHYFRKYLDQLVHPAAPWDVQPEEDYSLDAVMEKYLSLRMPSGKKRTGYSTTQKLLKHNWPNTTALKNIRSHKEDVPRKLLLLLYVITENISQDDYGPMASGLEDHWWVLNAILNDCGMPALDPRNAFDWLTLYAVTADEDESMSERMEQVIASLFSDLPQDA